MPSYESQKMGTVTCDFVRKQDFFELCTAWLTSNTFHHVVTLNPEMVVLAETNSDFRKAVNDAEMKVPDGAGLIWANWYVRSDFWSLIFSLIAFSFRNVERVTGVDTVLELARMAERMHKSIYLLGGTKSEIFKTGKKLQRLFPNLTLHSSRDHTFSLEGPADILQDIQEKKPDIIFVAYGAEKQTRWIEHHRKNLSFTRIAVGVGGAFAILSEEKTRAPEFLQKMNLEWLWRLFLEPSRLRRIWSATVEFPLLIKRQKQQTKNTF